MKENDCMTVSNEITKEEKSTEIPQRVSRKETEEQKEPKLEIHYADDVRPEDCKASTEPKTSEFRVEVFENYGRKDYGFSTEEEAKRFFEALFSPDAACFMAFLQQYVQGKGYVVIGTARMV
ncbi:MAG: hypothetical protein K2N94_07455 [Lachnospiraceae bacterium]|nr:hypothetical protein [Lachnospiraceae bacterium]